MILFDLNDNEDAPLWFMQIFYYIKFSKCIVPSWQENVVQKCCLCLCDVAL